MSIINPLLSSKYINYDIKKDNIKYVYFLIKKNNNTIDDDIYYYEIDKKVYDKISINLIIYKVEYNEHLKNQIFNALLISKKDLETYNVFNYDLEDDNIIIPYLDMNIENFIDYVSQFKTNDLLNIFKKIQINRYLKISNSYLENAIKNMDNSDMNYWCITKNLNFTGKFKHRCFQLFKKNSVNNDYNLNFLSDKYIDLSLILNSEIYIKPYSENNIDINEIFQNLDNKLQLILFTNLLITKKYCNLVINNSFILNLMTPQMNNYNNIFRYILGYTWLSLYCDECYSNNINSSDNFIFDINTASMLPIYPNIDNPKFNPYFALPVSDNELDFNNNFTSIIDYDKYVCHGISNLEEFRYRLNLFCVEKDYNIFENINFQSLNICICGGVISACLQKFHPLLNIFNFPDFKTKFIKYVNSYYSTSDIDIMFTCNSFETFETNVKIFFNHIYSNINKTFNNNDTINNNHTQLIPNYCVILYVSEETLENLDITIDNFYAYNTDINFIKLFDTIYTNLINEEFTRLNISFEIKEKLNIKLLLSDTKCNSVALNFKYKITSQYLKHPLELFNIKNNTFMSKVSKFHLPCIRGYYDNINVYMTPSCITAHLTYMNIDYKYIYTTQSPMEIIYKYRLRGFGTWLTKKEKISFTNNYNKNNIFGLKTIFNEIYKIPTNNNDLYITHTHPINMSQSIQNAKNKIRKNNKYNFINFEILNTILPNGNIEKINKGLLNIILAYF